jgi:inorganic pyrophosphatase
MTASTNSEFWAALEKLAAECPLVIDRPRGSHHPRYHKIVYPLDYGYLEGTSAMDGGGIDVWRGTLKNAGIVGVICTVDLLKKDSEIKILIGCTAGEIETVLAFHNEDDTMKAALISR